MLLSTTTSQGRNAAKTKQSKSKSYDYKVSAIVSTYNSEKFIRGCLDDLVAQTLYQKGKLEIVVPGTLAIERESGDNRPGDIQLAAERLAKAGRLLESGARP